MGIDQDRSGQPQHGGIIGKIPTTFVLRLISLSTRSSGLVDQCMVQCEGGKDAKAIRSPRASANIDATVVILGTSMAATLSTWSITSAPVGWAKIGPQSPHAGRVEGVWPRRIPSLGDRRPTTTDRGRDVEWAAAVVNCVCPIRIRLVGRPTDEDLVRLEDAVARLVSRQLQAAQRALRANSRGDAESVARIRAGQGFAANGRFAAATAHRRRCYLGCRGRVRCSSCPRLLRHQGEGPSWGRLFNSPAAR